MFEQKKKAYENFVTLFPLKEAKIDNFISVAMRPDGPTMGHAHSMGMYEIFGLPDLEICQVHPRMLLPAAGMIINRIAQYMVNAKQGIEGFRELKVDQTIGFSRVENFRVVLSKGNHKTPRWEITEAWPHKCDACGKEHTDEQFH